MRMHTLIILAALLSSQSPPRPIAPPLALRSPLHRIGEIRYTQKPLLSGGTFREYAQAAFDDQGVPFSPGKLKPGDAIFVSMNYLDFFLDHVVPMIRTPFVLITSNGNGTIDERYLPYLENPLLAAWFGKNMTLTHPKTRIIPSGIYPAHYGDARSAYALLNQHWRTLSLSTFFKEKANRAYFNMNLRSHPCRPPLEKFFQGQPYCLIKRQVPFEEFMDDLAHSRFVISPRGTNFDCARTWEALYAGSIPVVEAHGIEKVYEDLPVLIVPDLAQVTQEFLGKEFERMKTKTYKLAKLYANYWHDQIDRARLEAFLNAPQNAEVDFPIEKMDQEP